MKKITLEEWIKNKLEDKKYKKQFIINLDDVELWFEEYKNLGRNKKICIYCNTEYMPFFKNDWQTIYCSYDCRQNAAYFRAKLKKLK